MRRSARTNVSWVMSSARLRSPHPEQHVAEDDVVVAVEQLAEGGHVAGLGGLDQCPCAASLRRAAPRLRRSSRIGPAWSSCGRARTRSGLCRRGWGSGWRATPGCAVADPRGELWSGASVPLHPPGDGRSRWGAAEAGARDGSWLPAGPGRERAPPAGSMVRTPCRAPAQRAGVHRVGPRCAGTTGCMPLPRVSFATISWVGR